MSAQEVLGELSQRGVRVLVRGDRLTLRGPDEVLTADFTERLRQIKPQILETFVTALPASNAAPVSARTSLRPGGASIARAPRLRPAGLGARVEG